MHYGPYRTREEYLEGRAEARRWRSKNVASAYNGPFPIRSHRTLEQVDADERVRP